MKKMLIIAFLFFFNFLALAEEKKDDIWFVFKDESSGLMGFKDAKGHIVEKAQYYVEANRFKDLIYIWRDNQGHERYILTKSGKKIHDLPIFWNNGMNMADCESEGFIRFTNKEGKVGLLNKEGEITIPAEYDRLSQATGGFIVALTGAETIVDMSHQDPHSFLKGGEEYLIDVNNNILIKNFKSHEYINYYSLKIEENPSQNEIRESFLGVNGKYYSFINYEKEFEKWFFKEVLDNLSQENLMNITDEKMRYSIKNSNNHISEEIAESSTVIKDNYELIYKKLTAAQMMDERQYIYQIYQDNLFYDEELLSEEYYNSCSKRNNKKYPAMTVTVGSEIDPLASITFVRENDGYKIFKLYLQNDKIEDKQ